MSDGRRRGVGQEMHAGDQRIDRGDEFLIARTVEERGVVADAEAHIGTARTAVTEIALNELEL